MEQSCLMDTTAASPIMPHEYVDNKEQEKPVPSSHAELPPVKECNMFMSGFSDCAEEAIRYLTENEGLPFHHPLVMGLFAHLTEQRKLLYLEYLLRSTAQLYKGVSASNGSTNIQNETDTGECSRIEQASQNDRNGNISNTPTKADSETTELSNEPMQIPEQQERLATEIAEELFSLLQSDFYSEDDLVDEGFEDSCEP